MALKLKALDDLIDGDLEFPYDGKVYVAPAADAQTGLEAQRVLELSRTLGKHVEAVEKARKDGTEPPAEPDIDPDDEQLMEDWGQDLPRRMLGPCLDEMLEDGLPWAFILRATQTAYAYLVDGEEGAAQTWAGRGDNTPKELTVPHGSKARSTTTASRSTSSQRRATKRSPKPAAAATRGRTSSTTGKRSSST